MNIRNFVGLVDIFIILLFLFMIYTGWTKGFIDFLLRIFGKLFGVVLSAFFAFPLALILGPLFLDDLIDHQRISEFISQNTGLSDLISQSLATLVSNSAAIVISFFILFIGSKIITFIFRLIVRSLRHYKTFKFLDGTFGIVGMFVTYFIILFILFFILRLMINYDTFPGFTQFIINDMRLMTNHFSISRFLFNTNILDSIFDLILTSGGDHETIKNTYIFVTT